MRATGLATVAAVALTVLTTTDAAADSMDPALGRLVLDPACRTGSASGGGDYYNPASQFRRCRPNNAAFAKLISQYGAAVAPLATHSARTTGFGGYRFGIQGAYTSIDSDARYWRYGTQGPADESSGLASVENLNPDSILQTYSINLAKGFPFGLELGAGFGYVVNTEMVAGGGDIRLAVFEGFRESVPGFIPDLGVGGGVRTVTGTSEFKLTVVSFDATISKPIPIAGTVSLLPHFGYQLLWIFGDSGLIDLTPNTDPVSHCGYQGDNNPATPDPGKAGFDGQPNCTGSSADFNNNVVFRKAHLIARHRLNFGLGLRYQMVFFGLSFLTDVVSPFKANDTTDPDDTLFDGAAVDPRDPSGRTTVPIHRLGDDPRKNISGCPSCGDDEVGSQWTFAWELGAVF
jgi:hypothetical protein